LASGAGEFAGAEGTGELKLWDVKTLKEKADLKEHGSLVFSVAFSRNGKLLASAGRDGTTKLWSIETGKVVHTLRDEGNTNFAPNAKYVVFAPNDKTVATTSFDGEVRIWDVETGKPARTRRQDHRAGAPCRQSDTQAARRNGGGDRRRD
jgi:WD40 repeat protein